MKAVQQNLSKWMLLYVVLALGIGLLLGQANAGLIKANQDLLKTFSTVAVFLIIYPMMVNLKIESLLSAGKNLKGLGLAMFFNFIWGPLFGWLLARVFIADPSLALGFYLATVVPCSSMSVGYTGLAKGNVELATLTVALSFVLAIAAVPLWMTLFAAQRQVPLPMHEMLVTIVSVLIAPLLIGYLTRRALVRWLGEAKSQRLQPLFPSLSMLGMYALVFLIFFSKAGLIVGKWQTVGGMLVPEALFVGVTLIVVTWVNRRLRLPYADHMAVVFASTGKNEATALAISTMAFGPLVAIAPATVPVFQILFLVLNVRLAERVRRYFAKAPTVAKT
jgi:ACR3 family arsenite efflux pump ArsB